MHDKSQTGKRRATVVWHVVANAAAEHILEETPLRRVPLKNAAGPEARIIAHPPVLPLITPAVQMRLPGSASCTCHENEVAVNGRGEWTHIVDVSEHGLEGPIARERLPRQHTRMYCCQAGARIRPVFASPEDIPRPILKVAMRRAAEGTLPTL